MKKAISVMFVLLLLILTASHGMAGAATPPSAAEKPYAGATIRVLSMTAQVSDGIEEYLAQFQEQTGITVNLETYGEAQLREKIATEFITGSSTVDAFMLNPLNDMLPYNNNGWIEPLDDYVTSPDFDWDDFSSAPVNQISVDGRMLVLPLYYTQQLMYYRTDLFAEKGLAPPKDYEELLAVCQQLNDPAANLYAIACRGEKMALTSQFSPFLYAHGGGYIKDGASAFGSEESLQAVRFYGKLLGQYAPPGILSAGFAQMTQLFNSGQVAMVIDANALYSSITDEAESIYYDKVGVAPIPEGPQGRQSYMQAVWGASIYSGSNNKGAAWEFLKFVAGTDVAAYITPKGMPSYRDSVWENPAVIAQMPPDVIAAYTATTGADNLSLPRMTSVAEARDAIGEVVVYSIETLGEGPELAAMLKAASDKVDELLKGANEYGPDYSY